MAEYTIHKAGKLRGDKVDYPNGIGYCVWYPLTEADEDCGICFDFEEEDIDDFIQLLQKLKAAEPDIHSED